MGAHIEPDNRSRKPGNKVGIGRIEEEVVKTAYRRWAPVYDHTFGRVSETGRKHAIDLINTSAAPQNTILEVGVGTGLSLDHYRRDLSITGIDLSPEMLEKARARASQGDMPHISGLHQMDAGSLEFADDSFDIVTAMFVITVVPEPEQVMQELARVTKPGGQVLLVNHFSQEDGVRGWVERQMAPFAEVIGWRPVFEMSRVMGTSELELIERRALKPWGIFTLMRFAKQLPSTRRTQTQ